MTTQSNKLKIEIDLPPGEWERVPVHEKPGKGYMFLLGNTWQLGCYPDALREDTSIILIRPIPAVQPLAIGEWYRHNTGHECVWGKLVRLGDPTGSGALETFGGVEAHIFPELLEPIDPFETIYQLLDPKKDTPMEGDEVWHPKLGEWSKWRAGLRYDAPATLYRRLRTVLKAHLLEEFMPRARDKRERSGEGEGL